MFILRDSFNSRLISDIDNGKPSHTKHIGNAIKFPTSDEAEFYASDNGLDWSKYIVECAE